MYDELFRSIEIKDIKFLNDRLGDTVLYFICPNQYKASELLEIFQTNSFDLITFINKEKEFCLRIDFGNGYMYNLINIDRKKWMDFKYINLAYQNANDLEFLSADYRIRKGFQATA